VGHVIQPVRSSSFFLKMEKLCLEAEDMVSIDTNLFWFFPMSMGMLKEKAIELAKPKNNE
jgi:hypothetical protein